MSGAPWTLLGIARTEDETEIRRAYSRKLKQIDVDQDPVAFIALREALQTARAYAAHAHARQAERVPAGAEPEREPDAPSPDIEETAPQARPAWLDDIETVQALIFGERSREEIFAEVGERSERILDGPEMGEIDHAARVEQWAVQVILSGIPRSNGLLSPALRRFDWLDRYQKWDCPQAIHAVVGRYIDCQFVSDLQDGKGEFVRPFRVLERNARPGAAHAKAVARFMDMVRRQYPTVIQELPPEAVQAWDAFLERRSKRPIARVMRAWAIWRVKAGQFARRYRLDRLGVGLLWIVGILVLMGAVVATHGIALVFVLGSLFRSRK